MASSKEVWARVHDIRNAFNLENHETDEADYLMVTTWTSNGRKRYFFTLAINGHNRNFFARSTGDACDILRVVYQTLDLAMRGTRRGSM